MGGAGCTAASAIGTNRISIARDHLDAGVCTQPSGEAVCVSVGQKIDEGAAFQIHKDRAVTMASTPTLRSHFNRYAAGTFGNSAQSSTPSTPVLPWT